MNIQEYKEKYEREHPGELEKLQWDIPFQLSQLWFKIKMWWFN
jgi:hypothetical protein